MDDLCSQGELRGDDDEATDKLDDPVKLWARFKFGVQTARLKKFTDCSRSGKSLLLAITNGYSATLKTHCHLVIFHSVTVSLKHVQ